MTDAEKLRALATWHDLQDAKSGEQGREVQDDLRRIADLLERHGAAITALESGGWVLAPLNELIALQRVMPIPPDAVTYEQGWKVIDAAQALCVAILAAAPKPGNGL